MGDIHWRNRPSGIIISMLPAIFLDRDGVIIENVPTYVRSWEDVKLIPGALDALAHIRQSPYKILIVTNQSAVGRRIISTSQAEEINSRLYNVILHAGGRIDGIFMCPHAPQENCDCRKPKPGLILKAARQLDIDLDNSLLFGDAISDLLAAQAAGIRQTVLLRTGRGAEEEKLPHPPHLKPFLVYDNLARALEALVRL